LPAAKTGVRRKTGMFEKPTRKEGTTDGKAGKIMIPNVIRTTPTGVAKSQAQHN